MQDGVHKVYILESTKTDKVYVGVTSQTLKMRFTQHRNLFTYEVNHGFKMRLYREIDKDNLCIDDFTIRLLYKTRNKQQAKVIETEYIVDEEAKENSGGVYNTDGSKDNKRKPYGTAKED